MSGEPSVHLGVFQGEPAVTLAAGELEATFIPSLGMLGASLRFAGEEHLSLHGGLDAYREGHTTGLPLLAPWANRLSGLAYKAAGVSVDVDKKASGLHLDANGLPIHGTMAARPWKVARLIADERAAVLVALFAFEGDDLLAAFPFPHELEIEARVVPAGPAPSGPSRPPLAGAARPVRRGAPARLIVATTVRPTGRRKVPVSFGWHPYFCIPGVKRGDLRLLLPVREHLVLDDRGLPTGESHREKAESELLGRRTFDDGYRLRADRRLALEAEGTRLGIELDRSYPFAQVYAPAGKAFVALEPMTAPTDALTTGACPVAAPGGSFTARFSVTIEHVRTR